MPAWSQALVSSQSSWDTSVWVVDGVVSSVVLTRWAPAQEVDPGVRTWLGPTLGSPIEAAEALPGRPRPHRAAVRSRRARGPGRARARRRDRDGLLRRGLRRWTRPTGRSAAGSPPSRSGTRGPRAARREAMQDVWPLLAPVPEEPVVELVLGPDGLTAAPIGTPVEALRELPGVEPEGGNPGCEAWHASTPDTWARIVTVDGAVAAVRVDGQVGSLLPVGTRVDAGRGARRLPGARGPHARPRRGRPRRHRGRPRRHDEPVAGGALGAGRRGPGGRRRAPRSAASASARSPRPPPPPAEEPVMRASRWVPAAAVALLVVGVLAARDGSAAEESDLRPPVAGPGPVAGPSLPEEEAAADPRGERPPRGPAREHGRRSSTACRSRRRDGTVRGRVRGRRARRLPAGVAPATTGRRPGARPSGSSTASSPPWSWPGGTRRPRRWRRGCGRGWGPPSARRSPRPRPSPGRGRARNDRSASAAPRCGSCTCPAPGCRRSSPTSSSTGPSARTAAPAGSRPSRCGTPGPPGARARRSRPPGSTAARGGPDLQGAVLGPDGLTLAPIGTPSAALADVPGLTAEPETGVTGCEVWYGTTPEGGWLRVAAVDGVVAGVQVDGVFASTMPVRMGDTLEQVRAAYPEAADRTLDAGRRRPAAHGRAAAWCRSACGRRSGGCRTSTSRCSAGNPWSAASASGRSTRPPRRTAEPRATLGRAP